MRSSALAILLLTSCTPQMRGSVPAPPDPVRDVYAAWQKTDSIPSADTDKCRDYLGTLRVLHVPEHRFRNLCGKCGPTRQSKTDPDCTNHAAECIQLECVNSSRFSEVTMIGCDHALHVIVHESEPIDPALRHGVVHVLATCAIGHADSAHRMKELWCDGGLIQRAGGEEMC